MTDKSSPSSDSSAVDDADAGGASGHGRSGDVVRSGFVWNLLSFFFTQGAGIAIFLLLSRQLSVAMFGVFALAALLVDLFAANARWASIDALVQRRDFSPRALSTAFWILTAAAAFLAALFALGAGPVASAIEAPDVADVLPVMGLTLLLIPGSAVMESVLIRDMKFRTRAVRNMLATTIGGAMGLAAAFGPAPEWALVVQRVGVNIVTLVVLYAYTRWTPALVFDLGQARAFGARAGQLWASMLLATAHMRVVEACIGARAGVSALGLLRVAQRLHEALQGPVTGPIQALWVPVLSKIRSHNSRAWRLFLDLTRMSAFVALPTFVGLGLISTDLVALALDPRYAASANLLFVLGVSGYLIPVGFFGNQIFAALDRSDLAMKISVVALILVSPAAWFASAYGAVYALLASLVVMGGMGLFVTALQIRMMGGRISEFVAYLAAPYLATTAMTASVLSFAWWLPLDNVIARLGCQIALGAAVFIIWLLVFHRAAVRDTWVFISYARKPGAAPEADADPASEQASPTARPDAANPVRTADETPSQTTLKVASEMR